jgi:hypothetical protein
VGLGRWSTYFYGVQRGRIRIPGQTVGRASRWYVYEIFVNGANSSYEINDSE